jgi:hypothetical protein
VKPAPRCAPLFALALLLAPACRNPTGDAGEIPAAPPPAGPGPLVTGTVVDARTGRPVAGARLQGPGGVEATSDARGRFLLRGLALGASGDLVATWDGLSGRNRLRALAGGPLEVVVHVR